MIAFVVILDFQPIRTQMFISDSKSENYRAPASIFSVISCNKHITARRNTDEAYGGADDELKCKGAGFILSLSLDLYAEDNNRTPNFSEHTVRLKRLGYGKGLAILVKLSQLEYAPAFAATCDDEAEAEQAKSDSKKQEEQEELEEEAESECPDVEKEQFRCGQCGGRDEEGNCNERILNTTSYSKGVLASRILILVRKLPQIRPYFGIGIAKMNRVPDFEYGAGPKTENKTQIKSHPVEGDVNGLDDFGGLDCPDLEMEHFRYSDCGGSDDLGKSKGVGIHGCVISSPKLTCQDLEWEHEFQGCECLEDPDWSTEIPGLKRPNFGKGLAKLAKLPDIKYVSPPGSDCPAEGTIDQPESSDDTGCAGIYSKCTKGEHEGCSCKELECQMLRKNNFAVVNVAGWTTKESVKV
ncbi:hypothetical protein DL95DRAFT_416588 [Leptodontidium sp. 2 PMI_412]|nr:hypothetical protein DL95DRAFT_416588 [Leptodontidium sp. 2 PMI_412]